LVDVRRCKYFDSLALFRLRNSPEAVFYSPSKEPIGLLSHIRWTFRGQNIRNSFLVFDESGIIGYVRFSQLDDKVFTWSFAKDPSRTRVGRTLLQAGLVHCAPIVGARTVVAFIQANNTASLLLHEQFGFTPTERYPAAQVYDSDQVVLARQLD
jgi:RimJ/RimL family protein N-acetyltransferase